MVFSLDTPLGKHELSTQLMAREVLSRGHEPRWLRNALFVIDVDGIVLGWNMTRCTVTSTIAAEITGRKDYARQLLTQFGVNVALGRSFSGDQQEAALLFAQSAGWPLVVKPAGQGGGRGVTVGIKSDEEFLEAWANALPSRRVVIEQQFDGDEARFTVVGGQFVAVAGRRRPNVVGDGSSTIHDLVTSKQRARASNPHLANKPLHLTDARIGFLLEQGLSPEFVPATGATVWLEARGGAAGAPSTWTHGADSVEMTEVVHNSYIEVALNAYHAFPQLGVAGIDIIAKDFSVPADKENHIVLEVNSRPAIGAHHFPSIGSSQDVAKAIVDECFRYVGR